MTLEIVRKHLYFPTMKSIRWLPLLFVLLPLLEIFVLVKVGSIIGAWPTVGLVVFAGVAGVVLIRVQGFMTWRRVTEALARAQLPAKELLEGFVLLLGGLLLIIPGFITDILAISCLIPPLRRAALQWVIGHFIIARIRPQSSNQANDSSANPGIPRTIEGDFERDDDHRRPRR